jgi:hypothetical protein
MRASTTQMCLQLYRDLGYTVDVCERWVPSGQGGPQTRRDLFTILDLVAVGRGETIGVQTTAKSSMQSRVRKIREAPATAVLLEAGWRIHVVGWEQPGGKGTRYRSTTIEIES